MIYLNLLHRIFGRRDSLSRQEIDALKKEQSPQNIQDKEQDGGFNQDAVSGWSTIDSNVDEQMSTLDRKFLNQTRKSQYTTSSKGAYLFLFVFISTMMLLVIYTYQGKQLIQRDNQDPLVTENQRVLPDSASEKQAQQNKTVAYHITEKKLAEIDTYKNIDSTRQIRPKELMTQGASETSENPDRSMTSDEPVNQLAPKNIETIPTRKPRTLTYKNTPEIYLNELKTVDYRSIRKDKVITSPLRPQVGTPASLREPSKEEPLQKTAHKQTVDYLIYLENSHYYFLQKNYKRALVRYLTILDHYPDDVNAHFYAGLCFYNLGQFEKAVKQFDESYPLEIGNFREEARWFKAQSLYQLGQVEAAMSVFDSINKAGGFYSEQAKKRIEQLKPHR